MTSYRALLLITCALIICTVGSAQANRNQIRHCADDYRRFCHHWGLETRGLETCMRRHGDKLTNQCIAALVSAGEVSQAEANRRRQALGRRSQRVTPSVSSRRDGLHCRHPCLRRAQPRRHRANPGSNPWNVAGGMLQKVDRHHTIGVMEWTIAPLLS
jgi:hypothetical protein